MAFTAKRLFGYHRFQKQGINYLLYKLNSGMFIVLFINVII
jgi:hypothetical protein